MTQAVATAGAGTLAEYIEDRYGIRVDRSAEGHAAGRLGDLMHEYGCATSESFLETLRRGGRPELRDRIVEVMTSPRTAWFRDGHPFTVLRDVILPGRFEAAMGTGRPFRVWSAGCSTGQEPYSIAMTVLEYAGARNLPTPENVEILATDISPSMLMLAMAGRYDRVAMSTGLTESHRDRFFRGGLRTWEVEPGVKRLVTFRKRNLQDSFDGLGRFDAVFLRYVADAFSAGLRSDVMRRVADAVEPSGFLLLGEGETPEGAEREFEPFTQEGAAYYRRRE
jgi:chemotaxis protein methyltransferase CheR